MSNKWPIYFMAGAVFGPALLTLSNVIIFVVGLVAIGWMVKTGYEVHQEVVKEDDA